MHTNLHTSAARLYTSTSTIAKMTHPPAIPHSPLFSPFPSSSAPFLILILPSHARLGARMLLVRLPLS